MKSYENYNFAHCVTRRRHTGPYVKEDVIAAIYVTGANFAQMARVLDRRRSSVRDYVFANIEVKDVYDEIRETLLDIVEEMHNDLAKAGDGSACRYILSTQGKDRGYTTRTETTGKDGGPIEIGKVTLDVEKLTTDQLRAIRAAIKLVETDEKRDKHSA